MKSTWAAETEGIVPYPNSPGGGRAMTDDVLSRPKSLWKENPELILLLFGLFDDIGILDFRGRELLWTVEGEPITPDLLRRACCKLLQLNNFFSNQTKVSSVIRNILYYSE